MEPSQSPLSSNHLPLSIIVHVSRFLAKAVERLPSKPEKAGRTSYKYWNVRNERPIH